MKTGESGQSFSPKTDTVCSGKNLEEHCSKGGKVHARNKKIAMAQRRDLGKKYGKEFDKRNPQVREKFMPILVGQGYTDGHRNGSRTYAEFKK